MTRIRSFDAQTHGHLLDMVRRDQRTPAKLNSPADDTVTQPAISFWAYVVKTAPAATGGEPETTPAVFAPATVNPDMRTLKHGLCEFWIRNAESNRIERMSTTRDKLFNMNYHPIPAGWFVPVTWVSSDLYVMQANFSWLIKTGQDGVPRANGDEAGSGMCEIYRTGFDKKRTLLEDADGPILVEALNWHPSMTIGANRFVQATTLDGWCTINVDYC